MQRVERAVDDHHAIFAMQPVGAARIERAHGEPCLARQLGERGLETVAALHPHEMPAGVKARRAQQ